MKTLSLAAVVLLAASLVQASGVVTPPTLGFVDNFDGTTLNARWTPAPGVTYSVHDGVLDTKLSGAWLSNNNAFLTNIPAGDFTATVKLQFSPGPNGSTQQYAGWFDTAGLGLFGTAPGDNSLLAIGNTCDNSGWGNNFIQVATIPTR